MAKLRHDLAALPVPLPAPSASLSRIPLARAWFGPGVGVHNIESALASEHPDLALDLALGCVVFLDLLVPMANVRSMVRAEGGK